MQWLQIIGQVMNALSPEVKAKISEGLDKAQAHAKATKLPVDDIALFFFRAITGL